MYNDIGIFMLNCNNNFALILFKIPLVLNMNDIKYGILSCKILLIPIHDLFVYILWNISSLFINLFEYSCLKAHVCLHKRLLPH